MLDFAVNAFGSGVGDAMPDIGEDLFKMPFEHFCRFKHGFEPGVRRPEVLALEEFEGRGLVDIIPEFSERLLQSPGTAGFKPREASFLFGVPPPEGFLSQR